jgi:hypothetical protein
MNFKIPISRHKDNLFVFYNGWPYDLSAPPLVELNFSPTTQGVDKFLRYCADLKNIKNDFSIEIKNEWFFFYDAFLEFHCSYSNGWLYKIKSEKVKIIYDYVWICPYMNLFFDTNPKTLYVRVEENS